MLQNDWMRQLALWPLAMCLACTGQVTGTPPSDRQSQSGSAGSGGSGSPGNSPPSAGSSAEDPGLPRTKGGLLGTGTADPKAVGPMPLRRLTRAEYSRTLRDLLGDKTNPGASLPEDASGASGFASPGIVSTAEAGQLQDLAEAVAARAAAGGVDKLLGCSSVGSAETGCVRSFVQSFGRRAYRRALAGDELDRHLALYQQARTTLKQDVSAAVQTLLAAMLQSPFFLYRWELGLRTPTVTDGAVALTSDEVASRLSYFLWGTMPDAALFAAADADQLHDPAAVERQVARMLADAKAGDGVVSYFTQWLGLSHLGAVQKDTNRYKQVNDALLASMAAETQTFVKETVLKGDARLDTLFGSAESFVDGSLAALYGVSGVSGTALVRSKLDPQQRSGLLTHASVLTQHALPYETSPVRRGKLVREQLLCGVVAPPPANVDTTPPPVDDTKPMRDQFAEHVANAACKSCHQLMDPIGFGFESFDGIGRFRTVEAGKPVDASGTIFGLSSGDKAFGSFRELADALRASEDFRRCAANQWLRFAYGRADTAADLASFQAAYGAFDKSGFDTRELMTALATSRSFLNRALAAGEAL